MSEITIDPRTLARLQMLASIGEVSVGVSHETRNLITAISGFAQVARERANDPEAGLRLVARIEQQASRCIELLDRHLELARIDAGAPEPVDLRTIVETVAETIGHQLGLQRVDLSVDVPDGLPAVRGRRGELQQVVLNLAINAMHAMPAGGRIEISAVHRTGEIELVVADSGPGIAAELREKIFEPFFTTKRDKGTGLGLALCRQIVVAHGGTLELDHAVASGARFVVRLPVRG
jgi:signal transduction histidine kinase